MFPLKVENSDLQVVIDYQNKCDRISDSLDATPSIFDTVHADIEALGSSDGRESTFSSEQFLRMLIVKCMEGLLFRDVIINGKTRKFRTETMYYFTGNNRISECNSNHIINFLTIPSVSVDKLNKVLLQIKKSGDVIHFSHVQTLLQ